MPELRSGQRLPGTLIRQASLKDSLSRRDLVRLAASPRDCIVRVTGAAIVREFDVGHYLAESLGGSTCDVAVIADATMAIDRPIPGHCSDCDSLRVHCPPHGFGHARPDPGVMGVLMHLAAMKAPAKTIGVVPTISTDLSLYGGFLMVCDDPEDDHYTVVDGRCPICLILQFSTDKPKLTWDHEWQVSLDYMELLRNEAGHRSLHVAYSGGETTRRECLHVAALPQGDNAWNLLLVEDSGRTAEDLAKDVKFRNANPHVISCRTAELRTVIHQMGFSPE